MVSAMSYDNSVYRGPNGRASEVWQDGAALPAITLDAMQDGAKTHAVTRQPHQDASKLTNLYRQTIQSSTAKMPLHAADWKDGNRAESDLSNRYQDMAGVHLDRSERHQDAKRLNTIRGNDWQDRDRTQRPKRGNPWQLCRRAEIQRRSSSAKATRIASQRKTYWQDARHLPPGFYGTSYVAPPSSRCYTPPAAGHVDLRFVEALTRTQNIVFRCEALRERPPVALVPVKRTYIVINSVQLHRVDGDIELTTFSLALSIDMDSWVWSFNASLHASCLSNLMPGGPGEPVELEATINGASYRLLAENITRDRQFPTGKINVTGRGKSARLSDPYCRILTFTNTGERTAQQLMNDALTESGVSIGWDIDWRITDWLVPAGAWTHQGTHISAVNAIAAAAGAFIQPDPVTQTLRVRPRYPAAPWDWTSLTPDIELPSSAITQEGITWADLPAYNGVYISGSTTGGVLCGVKRAGTAGDVQSQMIIDSLITHADAGRQRGIQVLSATGRQTMYTLGLPVLSETGIIEPGTVLRYVDGGNARIGLVKGVSANAVMPSIRQTIELETYG
jgi:hypothetical protein